VTPSRPMVLTGTFLLAALGELGRNGTPQPCDPVALAAQWGTDQILRVRAWRCPWFQEM